LHSQIIQFLLYQLLLRPLVVININDFKEGVNTYRRPILFQKYKNTITGLISHEITKPYFIGSSNNQIRFVFDQQLIFKLFQITILFIRMSILLATMISYHFINSLFNFVCRIIAETNIQYQWIMIFSHFFNINHRSSDIFLHQTQIPNYLDLYIMKLHEIIFLSHCI